MSRHFRPWTIDQTQLLPAAVVDYVPADHLAQFVVALAREHLDLTEIVASYKSGLWSAAIRSARGDSPAALCLLYRSSFLAADREGMRRAGRFHDDRGARRARFFARSPTWQEASSAAAGEAVFAGAEACGKSRAGEARACRVALDGTKIKANASKPKAMSYERMKTRETELRAEVDRWLEAAEAADAQEDKLHGASRRGDETPGWIAGQTEALGQKSARPERRLRRRPHLPRRRKPKPKARRRRNARRRTASARGRFLARPQKSPIPRCSATLPIPTAACS